MLTNEEKLAAAKTVLAAGMGYLNIHEFRALREIIVHLMDTPEQREYADQILIEATTTKIDRRGIISDRRQTNHTEEYKDARDRNS